jgi:hypothetical protein
MDLVLHSSVNNTSNSISINNNLIRHSAIMVVVAWVILVRECAPVKDMFLLLLTWLFFYAGQSNPMSDKEAKRNKQAEYARQLQQDNGSGLPAQQQQHHQYQQQPHQALGDNGGGGLGHIGE